MTVDGYDILDNPDEAKRHIGYLPELPPLYLDMTVKEYLNFMFELKKVRLPKKPHLEEICHLVRIEDVYNRLIKNLSKGYRQRVGIAQALIGNPDVLILDEPDRSASTPSRLLRSAPLSTSSARITRLSFPPTFCRRFRLSVAGSLSSTRER